MDLVERFYETVYAALAPLWTVLTPSTPSEMLISGEPDAYGWVEWKLIRRSEGIDPALVEFEQELGHRLPQLFKLWHSRYYTLDGGIAIVRLPSIPSNDPLRSLRKQGGFLPERLYEMLIPFGTEGMLDAGPLCFDIRNPVPDADWPIRYWDHEWNGTEREIGPVIFSSFGKLLECAIHYWLPGALGWETQRSRISGFFDIDPDSAGGPGRDYWEGWLVDD
jgi:hypothetical protein